MKLIVSFFMWLVLLSMCYAQKPFFNEKDSLYKRKWNLVWEDNFSNKKNFDSLWNAENMSPSHILSSRWRENVTVRRGRLYLNNKKENRGGRSWTCASVTCKQLFKYGYFECRMKIYKSSGLNNSFWLYQWNPKVGRAFEIDIVEAHYPNEIHTNVHDRGIRGRVPSKQNALLIKAKENLFSDFHVYGLNWTKDSLEFYFDGQKVRTVKNTHCYDYANLVLGTAVLEWAGKISDKIDGTHMVVDYVRVFQPL